MLISIPMQLGSSLYQAYYMHTLALSEAASTAHVLKWFNKVPTITSSIQGRYGYWSCYHCFPREETFLQKLLVICLWVDGCECYEPAKEACLIKTSAYPVCGSYIVHNVSLWYSLLQQLALINFVALLRLFSDADFARFLNTLKKTETLKVCALVSTFSACHVLPLAMYQRCVHIVFGDGEVFPLPH